MNSNDSQPQLSEMNPLGRFSDRASDYVKYRPSYPAAAIDAILDGLGEPSQLTAADIGAGTGISSRLLAQRGVRVLAIEPNAEMRQAADPHALVEFRAGNSEATNLPDTSIDLVTCFQSFHWFNPVLTLPEFRRILKPGLAGCSLEPARPLRSSNARLHSNYQDWFSTRSSRKTRSIDRPFAS